MNKLLPISHPFECLERICGVFCGINNADCPDRWDFPVDCPLKDAE